MGSRSPLTRMHEELEVWFISVQVAACNLCSLRNREAEYDLVGEITTRHLAVDEFFVLRADMLMIYNPVTSGGEETGMLWHSQPIHAMCVESDN